jgi:hypothetical protein
MRKFIGFLVLAIVFFGITLPAVRMPVASAASQIDINIAIEKGLTYLNSTQASDGHWGDGWAPVTCTAMAVLSYENAPNNHFAWNLTDPYHTTVQKGLDWLFGTGTVQAMSVQPAGDPDTNGNGIGIWFNDGSGQVIYETPMVLIAIVASQSPAAVATTGPANVAGRTYHDIAVDIVDYLAWAQNENGAGRGGWRYQPNYGDSDNSVTQWPVLGMGAAELWGINAPAWVKSELLDYWLNTTQNFIGTYKTNNYYGAFGYGDSSWGPTGIESVAETAAGIIDLTYSGVPKTDYRIKAAQGYLVKDWLTTGGSTGWDVHMGNLYAMYAVMKACRLATLTPIKFIANYTGYPTIEWYNGTNQYADQLLTHQGVDGRWDNWKAAPDSIHTDLSTAWGVLILEYVPVVVKYNLEVNVVVTNTNNPIPGANVVAEGPNTYSDVTDGGKVTFSDIQAGTYNVTATAIGYLPASQFVDVNKNTTITLKMKPGAVIPEVPLGAITASISMIAAVLAYFFWPRKKRLEHHIS